MLGASYTAQWIQGGYCCQRSGGDLVIDDGK